MERFLTRGSEMLSPDIMKITSPIQMSNGDCFFQRPETLSSRRPRSAKCQDTIKRKFPATHSCRQCREMAFRLHHYEALIRDKESLQMPRVLECAVVVRLQPNPWAISNFVKCLSLARSSKWRKNGEKGRENKKLFCNCISIAAED